MKKENEGFDSQKRWGNSAMKGYGVNSPTMMTERKRFATKKSLVRKEAMERARSMHSVKH